MGGTGAGYALIVIAAVVALHGEVQSGHPLVSLIWKPTGHLQGWVGVLLLGVLMAGGYVASHWPTTFLRTSQNSPADGIETVGPLTSRLDHFILSCNIPPPNKTANDLFWELNDYKRNLDILGDAMGLRFSMTEIRGGIRIEAEAITKEAKERIYPLSSVGVTKMTIEVRRINKIELVSVFVAMPLQLAFYGWIPPNPAAPDTIVVVQRIEQILRGQAWNLSPNLDFLQHHPIKI